MEDEVALVFLNAISHREHQREQSLALDESRERILLQELDKVKQALKGGSTLRMKMGQQDTARSTWTSRGR